tara:strand:- start:457 stop:570 length:114 start_codon:yes stop_codon:yes gene_type:complete
MFVDHKMTFDVCHCWLAQQCIIPGGMSQNEVMGVAIA